MKAPFLILLLAALGSTSALAADTQEALAGVNGIKMLGKFQVSDIVFTADGKNPSSRCSPETKDEDRSSECGKEILILEINGKNGKEIALIRNQDSASGYESFLLQDTPSLTQIFSSDFNKTCQDSVATSEEIITQFCRARKVGRSLNSQTFFFQKNLKEQDYQKLSIADFRDCQSAQAIANGFVDLILPLVGASSPSFIIRGLESKHPSVSQERQISLIGIPYRVRDEYQLTQE